MVIKAEVNEKFYTTRRKVEVDVLASDKGKFTPGADLSVSVYLIDSLQKEDEMEIYSYSWLSSDLVGKIESPSYYFEEGREVSQAIDNLMLTHGWRRFEWESVIAGKRPLFKYLPELEGHMIMGKVLNHHTDKEEPNIITYLSSPGKSFQFLSSKSNENGQVLFNAKQFYGNNEIVVQTNHRTDSTYRIDMDNPFTERVSSYKVPYFNISENFKDQLIHHSISNQVEHVFNTDEKGVLSHANDTIPFYGKADRKYVLDDYTRFATLEEVMREYVPEVAVRRRKGEYHFLVNNTPHKTIFENNPLVLLDGVPIFDLNKFMAFSPSKIKSLEVVTRKYFFGPVISEGLLSFRTYDGDLGGFELNPQSLVIEYEGLQKQRQFYHPKYESQEQLTKRTPDFRNVLYWSPSIKTDAEGKLKIVFYTSDFEGKYIGLIQGIIGNGSMGSGSFSFEVKKPL